jgi:hypothetical protein
MNDKQKSANYQKLKDTLNRLAIAWGADLFGVADLSEASNYLEQEFGRSFTGLNRAVSLAVSFPREVIEELLQGPTHTSPFLNHSRINDRKPEWKTILVLAPAPQPNRIVLGRAVGATGRRLGPPQGRSVNRRTSADQKGRLWRLLQPGR